MEAMARFLSILAPLMALGWSILYLADWGRVTHYSVTARQMDACIELWMRLEQQPPGPGHWFVEAVGGPLATFETTECRVTWRHPPRWPWQRAWRLHRFLEHLSASADIRQVHTTYRPPPAFWPIVLLLALWFYRRDERGRFSHRSAATRATTASRPTHRSLWHARGGSKARH